ncbi:MAG TPA: T9SS type A sorting domain-containing protein [Crocinitomix sp.]|nr:T9SS type A sorting domain-containing protein [Crocinitomix sp.]
MKNIFSLFILLIYYNHLLFAQCVNGVGPTSTIDSNVESVTLIGDVGSINYVGCPGIIGIEDQTSLSTTLAAGGSYTISVQFGTCGGNYSGLGEVWIDFNGNQTFEPTESLGTWSGIPPTSISVFSFIVPSTVTNLPVKLRVMQKEGSGSLPLDPCASFTWGSVVDFTINFTGGIDCSTYIGNNETDPIIVNNLPYADNHNNSVCYSNDNPVYNSADVYYLVTPTNGTQQITASLCGSNFDTYISAYDTQGNNLAFNDDFCGPQSEITIDVQNLDSVYIIVEGWGLETGDYILNIYENTSSITSIIQNTNISLHPNPAQHSFIINGVNDADVSISIYNVNGKTVKRIFNYKGNEIIIDSLPNGIYFVEIMIENIIFTKKLIIQ